MKQNKNRNIIIEIYYQIQNKLYQLDYQILLKQSNQLVTNMSYFDPLYPTIEATRLQLQRSFSALQQKLRLQRQMDMIRSNQQLLVRGVPPPLIPPHPYFSFHEDKYYKELLKQTDNLKKENDKNPNTSQNPSNKKNNQKNQAYPVQQIYRSNQKSLRNPITQSQFYKKVYQRELNERLKILRQRQSSEVQHLSRLEKLQKQRERLLQQQRRNPSIQRDRRLEGTNQKRNRSYQQDEDLIKRYQDGTKARQYRDQIQYKQNYQSAAKNTKGFASGSTQNYNRSPYDNIKYDSEKKDNYGGYRSGYGYDYDHNYGRNRSKSGDRYESRYYGPNDYKYPRQQNQRFNQGWDRQNERHKDRQRNREEDRQNYRQRDREENRHNHRNLGKNDPEDIDKDYRQNDHRYDDRRQNERYEPKNNYDRDRYNDNDPKRSISWNDNGRQKKRQENYGKNQKSSAKKKQIQKKIQQLQQLKNKRAIQGRHQEKTFQRNISGNKSHQKQRSGQKYYNYVQTNMNRNISGNSYGYSQKVKLNQKNRPRDFKKDNVQSHSQHVGLNTHLDQQSNLPLPKFGQRNQPKPTKKPSPYQNQYNSNSNLDNKSDRKNNIPRNPQSTKQQVEGRYSSKSIQNLKPINKGKDKSSSPTSTKKPIKQDSSNPWNQILQRNTSRSPKRNISKNTSNMHKSIEDASTSRIKQSKNSQAQSRKVKENMDDWARVPPGAGPQQIALFKIKQRVHQSGVVYEDSKLKNNRHEINHLMNKYDCEVKLRKELKDKINSHPIVLKKHAMVSK